MSRPSRTAAASVAHVVAHQRPALVHRAAVEVRHPAAPLLGQRSRPPRCARARPPPRRPIAGALYSTVHVANSATLRTDRGPRSQRPPAAGRPSPGRSASAGLPRRRNHAENVGRWNAASSACDGCRRSTCMNARCTPARSSSWTAAPAGCRACPTRSVLPSIRSCRLTPLRRASRRPRPQHQPRKIHRPPMRRRVRAMVEAELALITEIDHFLDVARPAASRRPHPPPRRPADQTSP